MGVRGLTMFIAENSKLYLKPYELCHCYLVIDGNNIAVQLYVSLSKHYSAFGGDYDEYYQTVKDFFLMLKKCEVTPIVLFDGGYEARKKKIITLRINSKLATARAFTKGFSRAKFRPLFLKHTFYEVLEDLGIICLQCDLEADGEIAAVARALNCPVLSYDSDFYIYDVLYIPFPTVYTNPVKFNDSDNYYVRCSVYNVTNFLDQFEGLDKSQLPVIATILGNDFTVSTIFQKFFGHITLPKSKSKSYNQRKIYGLLNWLKKEDVESAKKLILTHTDKKSEEKVLEAIKSSTENYTSLCVSENVINKLSGMIKDIRLDKKKLAVNLPSEVVKLHYYSEIAGLIMNLINHQTYFTVIQVENVYDKSSHFPSIQLISDMYTMLTPFIKKKKKKYLKLYLVIKNCYTPIKIEDNPSNVLLKVNLVDLLKQPKKERLKFLFQVAYINEDELNIVCNNNWSIFIMSFIYWIKKLNNLISLAHIHALILMMIANQIVQKSVGYFRSLDKFLKSKGKLLDKLKNTPVTTGEYKNFQEMLKGVTQYEKLLIQSILIPYRQATEKGVGKEYCILTIHLFASFQSCLLHIMEWNALLDFPLPQLKISDFYSGTLLFNLYLTIRHKPQVEKFGCNLFKDAPNLAKIYKYLYEGLCRYSEKNPPVGRKPKKRKKKKNLGSNENEEDSEKILFETDIDEDEYDDKCNPYAVLLKNNEI